MAIYTKAPKGWEYNPGRMGYSNKANGKFIPDRELSDASVEERNEFMTKGTFEYKPRKVISIFCKCGELQLRLYPYGSFNLPPKQEIPMCKRCRNKSLK